ncbi:Prenyltransferase and squalene oxidase repeat-containing protein [Streptomyces sp. cf386]|uniref:prenyltransferase/squalene oxidase repeat-containing protein n=1 Tax=Streptomyces sp. cf386 TaxID=1761904 RepID=UPI000886D54E|nr:prenyltransferase/squalene oxidase repeat-containing protein [Streptomyces sp. cf386]SDO22930.1 Prenyltransferase and squalene oxidase repeat-containing protein [Streptomyces sp. cf386]
MYVRRSAAALAAVTVIGTAGATPAIAVDHTPSASPSVALPAGLYGTGDPTYDGVWRQSLALIAQSRVGIQPAVKAIDWLAGQQCADGAFAAFRADAGKACDAKTMVDTNSTAAAVQGLAAVGGHEKEIGKAVTWLKSVQNKDGGWGYTPGGASDANSTSVVIGALDAAGGDPAEVRKDGKSPSDALVKLALPCADGGAFAYQPDKKGKLAANADATAAAVVGTLGTGMLSVKAGEKKDVACAGAADLTAEQAGANGAAYLAKAVEKDGYLKSALAGAEDQPDYGNTADAVVALAAEAGAAAAQKPLGWLEKNAAQWAAQSGPAAYAQLILAAEATGTDPRAFGGTDLVKQLNAQGPAPRTAESESAKASQEKQNEKDNDKGVSLWWIIGVGLVGGIGIGFLISARKKNRQP